MYVQLWLKHFLQNTTLPDEKSYPTQLMTYKHALLLHKNYNTESSASEWLFFNQTFNACEPKVNLVELSNFKIGKNILSNRFTLFNGKITLNMLTKVTFHTKLYIKNFVEDRYWKINCNWITIFVITISIAPHWK